MPKINIAEKAVIDSLGVNGTIYKINISQNSLVSQPCCGWAKTFIVAPNSTKYSAINGQDIIDQS